MTVTRVKVVVSEDDREVGVIQVRYYDMQAYAVQLVTPHGIDAKLERDVGDDA